jgi:hypothetical protein
MQNFFPFKTCETPHKDSIIKQPVSAFFNILSCIILIYYIIIAKTFAIKLCLFSFLLFQAFHAFSHMHHIEGNIQTIIIHILSYLLSITSFYTLFILCKKLPSYSIILFIIILIVIDIYIFLFQNHSILGIFSGFAIIVVTYLSYYMFYPKFIKTILKYIILGLFILSLVIINEKMNCDNMIAYSNLPYHAIIEIIGLILFTSLGYMFIIWENKID